MRVPCLIVALICVACDSASEFPPVSIVDAAPDAASADAASIDTGVDGALADMRVALDAGAMDAALLDAGTTDQTMPDAAIDDATPPDQQIIEQTEIERVRAGFGLMHTVAGLGRIGDKGENGWEPGFEGGDAREAELSRPHMTMADAAGNLYIADKDAHAIRKVEVDGRITTFAGTSEAGDDGDAGRADQMRLNAPNGLWAQPDGTVFILDLGNAAIRRVDPDGAFTTLFRDPAGMGNGRGLWVAPDARLVYYAAGSAVRRWTPNGGVETVMTGFESLGNLTVDPDGHLVVTDRGADRVYRIVNGARIPIAGNGEKDGGGDGEAALMTGLHEVRGVWFHPEGGYLLATHKGGQVWYVDTAGIIHRLVHGDNDRDTHAGDGEPLSSRGKKVSEVRAVTMAPDGALLITENDRGFIRRVAPR